MTLLHKPTHEDVDTSIDWENRCAHCGAVMGDVVHLRREYCSAKCYNDHYHAMEREARQAEKAGRPCVVCGEPIPVERRADATHCSMTCFRRHHKRRKTPRECIVCEKEFFPFSLGRQRKHVYCSPECARATIRPLTATRFDRMVGG